MIESENAEPEMTLTEQARVLSKSMQIVEERDEACASVRRAICAALRKVRREHKASLKQMKITDMWSRRI